MVTLDSLPKGYSAPQVLVPAEQSEFELPLTFAFGSKAGELKGVKLVALAAPVVDDVGQEQRDRRGDQRRSRREAHRRAAEGNL